MEIATKKKEYKIDATGRKLGRVASEISSIILGKNSPDFAPNKIANVKIIVSGVESLNISEDKLENTSYKRYSGYPGGQKTESMKKIIDKKGMTEILRLAVIGMIPRNKLRNGRMKNLTFSQ
jgi:large subunit ribosomal protein L13